MRKQGKRGCRERRARKLVETLASVLHARVEEGARPTLVLPSSISESHSLRAATCNVSTFLEILRHRAWEGESQQRWWRALRAYPQPAGVVSFVVVGIIQACGTHPRMRACVSTASLSNAQAERWRVRVSRSPLPRFLTLPLHPGGTELPCVLIIRSWSVLRRRGNSVLFRQRG